MRLLLTTDAVGGVWTYTAELARGLPRHGIEVVLAVLGPEPGEDQARDIDRLDGVRLLRTGLPLDWLSDEAATRRAGEALAGIAKRERADLVHLNAPALAAWRPFDVPVIAVAHGCVTTWWEAAKAEPLAPEFRWHAEAMAKGLSAADLTIAPSASHAATIRRRYDLRTSPAVVANGRDVALPPTPEAPRAEALTVGRLWDPVKQAALLDAVAATLACPFAAAGATVGPHGESVALSHLDVLGTLTQPELALRLARRPVFVSAATFEPFGLAVLEAASAGCALVLSDISTFRELWEGAARFVPADDPGAFAGVIARLLADPGERARLGDAARARAGRYTGAAMCAAMAGHYRAVLARRAAA